MAISPDFQDYLYELFEPVGTVKVKRMFGGAGVFYRDIMIALISAEQVYLKADAITEPRFEEEGLDAFVYETKDGKRTVMSYRLMPDRAYDDPDELKEWAELAIEAAFRAVAKKPSRKKKT